MKKYLGIFLVGVLLILGGCARKGNDKNNVEETNQNTNEAAININADADVEVNRNTNINTNTRNTNVNTSQKNQNTNVNSNTNTTGPIIKENGNSNLNTNVNTNTNENTSVTCDDADITGSWRITVSEEGATFAPAEVDKSFVFDNQGTGTATEHYEDPDATFDASHAGTWTRQGCEMHYDGTATGSGVHSESGNFNLKFDVTMDAVISSDGEYMTGDWNSKEVYYNTVVSTTDYVTGTIKGLKE